MLLLPGRLIDVRSLTKGKITRGRTLSYLTLADEMTMSLFSHFPACPFDSTACQPCIDKYLDELSCTPSWHNIKRHKYNRRGGVHSIPMCVLQDAWDDAGM